MLSRIVPTTASKSLIALVLGATVLLAVGLANAEDAVGIVQSVDPAARTIVLDNGNTYTVAEDIALEGLKPGDEVMVSYEETGGKLTVTALQKAQ